MPAAKPLEFRPRAVASTREHLNGRRYYVEVEGPTTPPYDDEVRIHANDPSGVFLSKIVP